MKKYKILCLLDYYLPGFRAGGPVRSMLNFVENLGNEFEILIVCNDHDLKNKKSYRNVKIDSWNKVGKAKVFYASRKNLTIMGLVKILKNIEYDLLYLNSFFSPKFTILPLFLRRFVIKKKKPCIICPRGNFSPEALKLKNFKKEVYLKLFKRLNLYQDLTWQASSEHEKNHITKKLSNKMRNIYVVPDFTPKPLQSLNDKFQPREKGSLRILFLSRISPMKNLDFLLKVLAKVEIFVELSIYGPKEDPDYWNFCQNLIKVLPNNISVNVGKEISFEKITNIFDKHDLFISPTRGEAFGNAIIESLSYGLPAMISDKTLWKNDKFGGLEILRLDQNSWVEAITKWSKFEGRILKKKRQAALDYAKHDYSNSLALKKNKELFYSAL